MRATALAPLAWAAAGGALYFLAYVGFGVWPLLFVFLTPLWHALETCDDDRVSRSLLAGITFGAVAYAGGFSWLWRLVEVFLAGNVALGGALWLAYGAWFAASFAAYALVYRALRRRGDSVAIAGIAPLVLVEWLWPQIFPVNAGAALISAPAPLVQVADLGGPLLLTVLVACGNLAVFATWGWLRGARPRPRAARHASRAHAGGV
ncbi:MAG: hypothetical protein AB1689_14890, partial [Thermodesulfobacteriota bacterium]